MVAVFTDALRTLNSLLSAGIAITAFSLLLYSFSFNLRDRVARSLAMIMLCVVVVFVAETMSGIARLPGQFNFWLRLQWVGILFLPPAYMHFSDALLSTTGRPSRGRRRLVVRALFLVSLGFLLLLPTNLLVGQIVEDSPAPHLQRTWLTWVFAFYYVVVMALAWANFVRAFRRTVTAASRRRMTYLLVGALAPALGSYPYLLFGSGIAAHWPVLFWLARQFQQPAYAWYELQHAAPSAQDLLWYQPATTGPKGSNLPLDKYFRDSEIATMRSEWENSKALFVGGRGSLR